MTMFLSWERRGGIWGRVYNDGRFEPATPSELFAKAIARYPDLVELVPGYCDQRPYGLLADGTEVIV